jgi:Tripartite tricarboxylate transporter family receptor
MSVEAVRTATNSSSEPKEHMLVPEHVRKAASKGVIFEKRPVKDTAGKPVAGLFGILAPAQTPKPVLDRLTGEVRKATADSQFRDRMTAQGLEVVGSTPEDMLALMQSDTKKWADVIRATGAKIQQ